MQKEPLTIEELISSLYAAYLSNLESISYAHRVDCADRTKFEVIIRQSISPVFDRIANPDGGTDARDAMLEWFCVLAEGERESSWRLTIVPPTWVDVFAEFYQRGAIGLLAFGMAVRGVYMLGASALDKGGERHTDYLSIMRMMPPEALMHDSELAALNALPPAIRLYRAAVVKTNEQAACGLSWSRQQHYPALHGLRRRILMREVGNTKGRLRLVTVEVPRELILIYKHDSAKDGEVLIDYELLDFAAVEELPALSDDAILLSGVMNGCDGRSGLNGIYRALSGMGQGLAQLGS